MGIAREGFNFLGQAMGSAQEQMTQMMGIGILGLGIPGQMERFRELAKKSEGEFHDIWDPTTQRVNQRRLDLATAFADPKKWQKQAHNVAVLGEEARTKAEQNVERVEERVALSEQKFEEDRAEALTDLWHTQVRDLQSARESSDAFVDQAVAEQEKLLQQSGRENDPEARLQAEQTLKLGYKQQLLKSQRAINADYEKSRVELHSRLAETREELMTANTKALSEAQMFSSQMTRWTARDAFDAYKGAAEGASQMANTLNAMDTLATSFQDRITRDRTNLELKTEELGVTTIFAMANALLNWDISVPQLAEEQQSSSGGSSGGSFSAGLNLAPASVGYSS